MNHLKPRASYRVPSFAETVSIGIIDSLCTLFVNDQALVKASVTRHGSEAKIYWPKEKTPFQPQSLLLCLLACEYLFGHMEGLEKVQVDCESQEHLEALRKHSFESLDKVATISKMKFFQDPLLWHRNASYPIGAEEWTATGAKSHPRRPEVAPGVIYRRTIPTLGKELRFETLELDRHLKVFHDWQNQKRVAHFWELDQSESELRSYLEKVNADPHHFPAIASIDGEPSGYFEIYWAPEDRLGPYYDDQPFDRAFHFLIGNKAHLGRSYFNAFVESITHFLFLDEARTRTILAEPRADNIALLHYLSKFTFWEKRFEFDFPHKRAALLASRREDFFAKATFQ